MAGLLLGMTVGLFVGGLFAALFTWQLGRKQSWDLRAGWNLVPVVVANQDMAEGEEVTFDKIAQRSAPEQFV
ncbi:MAG TPA: Flp pilus assembly protein CpaB, partial [Archangium sp.]